MTEEDIAQVIARHVGKPLDEAEAAVTAELLELAGAEPPPAVDVEMRGDVMDFVVSWRRPRVTAFPFMMRFERNGD